MRLFQSGYRVGNGVIYFHDLHRVQGTLNWTASRSGIKDTCWSLRVWQDSGPRFIRTCARAGSRILVRGTQHSFDPRWALSPKFAQNRVFPCSCLKTAWFWKKKMGASGAVPPGPPGSTSVCDFHVTMSRVFSGPRNMFTTFWAHTNLTLTHSALWWSLISIFVLTRDLKRAVQQPNFWDIREIPRLSSHFFWQLQILELLTVFTFRRLRLAFRKFRGSAFFEEQHCFWWVTSQRNVSFVGVGNTLPWRTERSTLI